MSPHVWRMNYSIAMNLPRLPKIAETLHRMADQPENYSDEKIHEYVQYIVSLMKKTGRVTTQRFGMENLPPEGGYILCPNHQGKYDAYSIVDTHDKPVSIVMDREMSYFIFVSEIVDALRGKRMDIHNSRQALTVIKEIAAEVEQGRRFVIFPEGAYDDSKHNSLWQFRPGCFKAATTVKAPIVPVALVDSYKVYNSPKPGPVKTQVHYLQPLYYEDYKDLNTHRIAEIVSSRIAEKLTELGYPQKIAD